jgi:hypothetical protein
MAAFVARNVSIPNMILSNVRAAQEGVALLVKRWLAIKLVELVVSSFVEFSSQILRSADDI